MNECSTDSSQMTQILFIQGSVEHYAEVPIFTVSGNW